MSNHNYGEEGGGLYNGTGGAAGQYGPQTPLDPLHRQGGTEAEERARAHEAATGGPGAANSPDLDPSSFLSGGQK